MAKKKIQFDKRTLNESAKTYLKDSYITMHQVAKMYGVSQPILSRMFFFGIADGVFTEELSKKLCDKIIYAYRDQIGIRKEKWDKAMELREINFEIDAHKEEIPKLVDEVRRLQSLLAWPDEDEKETLQSELAKAQNELANSLKGISNLITVRKQIISTLSFVTP